MSYVLGTGKRLSVEDVLLLSQAKSNLISLDEAAVARFATMCLEVVEKEQSNFYPVLGELKIEKVKTNDLSIEVRRAGIIIRLHSLFNGKSAVRPATLNCLAALINRQVTPYFSSFEKAGLELIEFFSGKGYASTPDSELISASEALQILELPAHPFTDYESVAFIKHPFLLMGLATVVIGGASQLAKVADPISALSIEAKGASLDPFDSAAFETFRQHRGQITSANNIRIMLEGSKRTGSAANIDSTLCAFHNVPQIHGPNHDVIAQALKSIEIELNSSENGPLNPNAGLTFDSTESRLLMENVGNALLSLLIASQNRIKFLCGGEVHIVYLNDDLLKPYHFLKGLSDSFSRELVASLFVINSIENDLLSAKKGKEDKKEKVVDYKAKQQLDENDLTPAQREKIEAKRREKAEKAAAKAAAKEQRKGGVTLGIGTTSVRSIVTDALLKTSSEEGELNIDAYNSPRFIAALNSYLNPLNISENAFATQFSKILEQLTIGGKRKPKLPKGTRDYTPDQMRIREQVFNAIRTVFKRHGGVEIDTPVFELKEVLTGKYGEDSKLIYDLADQGGELLSLRYDLTVPFARFLALNAGIGNIKRYHIAKVYRRDQPQLNRGRYREFYQCDFDVAGSYSLMIPDAEVVTIAAEILSELPIGNFLIKLSHRRLLDAIFEICGVPKEKFRPICSAVDKLDKNTWEEVKAEMVFEKGLNPEVADKISTFVLNQGKPLELWKKLMEAELFGAHAGANEAMKELKLLFDYLSAMGTLEYVLFDLSLARGLDYYTGVIYEAVLIDGIAQVGSIAAGGRYDNLVGMFSPSGVQTPCVGVSIGVERVFTIMEMKARQMNLLQSSHVQVFVASIGPNLMLERMKIAQNLWKSNISAEFSHLDNPKFKKQLDESLERGIPFMVVFGEDELNRGVIKVKDMKNHVEIEVPSASVVEELTKLGCRPINAAGDVGFVELLKQNNLSSPEPVN